MKERLDGLFGFHFWYAGLSATRLMMSNLITSSASFLVKPRTMSGLQMQERMIDSVSKGCQGNGLHG